VGRKVVDRNFDYLPFTQKIEVFDQELGLEGIRMVVVDCRPFREHELGSVSVVGIVLDDRDSGDCRCHCSRDRGLA
jgi:hypothetical protein